MSGFDNYLQTEMSPASSSWQTPGHYTPRKRRKVSGNEVDNLGAPSSGRDTLTESVSSSSLLDRLSPRTSHPSRVRTSTQSQSHIRLLDGLAEMDSANSIISTARFSTPINKQPHTNRVMDAEGGRVAEQTPKTMPSSKTTSGLQTNGAIVWSTDNPLKHVLGMPSILEELGRTNPVSSSVPSTRESSTERMYSMPISPPMRQNTAEALVPILLQHMSRQADVQTALDSNSLKAAVSSILVSPSFRVIAKKMDLVHDQLKGTSVATMEEDDLEKQLSSLYAAHNDIQQSPSLQSNSHHSFSVQKIPPSLATMSVDEKMQTLEHVLGVSNQKDTQIGDDSVAYNTNVPTVNSGLITGQPLRPSLNPSLMSPVSSTASHSQQERRQLQHFSQGMPQEPPAGSGYQYSRPSGTRVSPIRHDRSFSHDRYSPRDPLIHPPSIPRSPYSARGPRRASPYRRQRPPSVRRSHSPLRSASPRRYEYDKYDLNSRQEVSNTGKYGDMYPRQWNTYNTVKRREYVPIEHLPRILDSRHESHRRSQTSPSNLTTHPGEHHWQSEHDMQPVASHHSTGPRTPSDTIVDIFRSPSEPLVPHSHLDSAPVPQISAEIPNMNLCNIEKMATTQKSTLVPISQTSVPGIWVFKHACPGLGITVINFEVDTNTAEEYNLTKHDSTEPRVLNPDMLSDFFPKLKLSLLCIPTSSFKEIYESEEYRGSPEPLARALWNIPTHWPPKGQLIVDVNVGKHWGQSWLPWSMDENCPPLDVTTAVQQGSNTIRCLQLSGFDYTFLLHAAPNPLPEFPSSSTEFTANAEESDSEEAEPEEAELFNISSSITYTV